MDPKQLKALYDQTEAANRTKAVSTAKANVAAQEDLRELDARGKAALHNVVLPYLRDVQNEFEDAAFTLRVLGVDLSDGMPIGVAFHVGSNPEYGVSVNAGKVTVWRGFEPKLGSDRTEIKFVFPATVEPFIGSIDDLTREKIASLIAIAIRNG